MRPGQDGDEVALGPSPAVVPEMISAHSRVVAHPQDVPVTGDGPVDAALDQVRSLLEHPRPASQEAAVLSSVHEALARRLGDAAG